MCTCACSGSRSALHNAVFSATHRRWCCYVQISAHPCVFPSRADSNRFYAFASLLCHRVIAQGHIRHWAALTDSNLAPLNATMWHSSQNGSNLCGKCVIFFLKPRVTFSFGKRTGFSLYGNRRLLQCPLLIRYITRTL